MHIRFDESPAASKSEGFILFALCMFTSAFHPSWKRQRCTCLHQQHPQFTQSLTQNKVHWDFKVEHTIMWNRVIISSMLLYMKVYMSEKIHTKCLGCNAATLHVVCVMLHCYYLPTYVFNSAELKFRHIVWVFFRGTLGNKQKQEYARQADRKWGQLIAKLYARIITGMFWRYRMCNQWCV